MCYCDMPAIQNRTDIKAARKPRRCSECRVMIEVGQPYQRYDALWDGAWGHYAFCPGCQAAWQAAWTLMDCYCEASVGEVWSALDAEGIAVPYWLYEHYRQKARAA